MTETVICLLQKVILTIIIVFKESFVYYLIYKQTVLEVKFKTNLLFSI